jgi:hypothetical protein
MNLLFAILLPMVLALPKDPPPAPATPVRIVFVEPSPQGEDVHGPLRAEALSGLAWWGPCGGQVVAEAAVTVKDAHADWTWLNDLAAPGVVTVAILTTPGPVNLGGGVWAYGWHRAWGDHVLYTVAGGEPGGAGEGAILAHEWGHVLGFGDVANTSPKALMEYPEPAFSSGYHAERCP